MNTGLNEWMDDDDFSRSFPVFSIFHLPNFWKVIWKNDRTLVNGWSFPISYKIFQHVRSSMDPNPTKPDMQLLSHHLIISCITSLQILMYVSNVLKLPFFTCTWSIRPQSVSRLHPSQFHRFARLWRGPCRCRRRRPHCGVARCGWSLSKVNNYNRR